VVHRRELLEVLEPRFAARDADGLAAALRARGVPAGPVNDIGAVLAAPQVLHRDMVVSDGDYRGIGVPVKLSRSGAAPVRAPAPPGADTARVLAELGYGADEIAALMP
jgi:crotonobetainyl-CoA:carnitine CoA-transferase CaiB-like acyl-CoA transferase